VHPGGKKGSLISGQEQLQQTVYRAIVQGQLQHTYYRAVVQCEFTYFSEGLAHHTSSSFLMALFLKEKNEKKEKGRTWNTFVCPWL